MMFMHLVRVKVIQLLIIRMVGDDGESTRTDPDPQVFLGGFRGVKGTNSAASHLYETEASDTSSLLSESTWQKSCVSLAELEPGKLPGCSFMFSSIIMFQHSELIIIRYS